MAFKQSRRTVSISGDTYRKFKTDCNAAGISMSQRTEQLIKMWLAGEITITLAAKVEMVQKPKCDCGTNSRVHDSKCSLFTQQPWPAGVVRKTVPDGVGHYFNDENKNL